MSTRREVTALRPPPAELVIEHTAVVHLVEAEVPAGIAWLIENYVPPRSLVGREHGSWLGDDRVVEAEATVYLSAPRTESFIEWIARRHPAEAKR